MFFGAMSFDVNADRVKNSVATLCRNCTICLFRLLLAVATTGGGWRRDYFR